MSDTERRGHRLLFDAARGPLSRRHLADQLHDVVTELTGGQRKGIPRWLMVSVLHDDRNDHGFDVRLADLQAAIASAVERGTLKAEGDPPHSVYAYRKPDRWLAWQTRAGTH